MKKPKKRKPAYWIFGELTKKQVKVEDLASGLGVTPRMVYHVIRGGRYRTRRIQEVVAAALGRKFENVWGEEQAGHWGAWRGKARPTETRRAGNE